MGCKQNMFSEMKKKYSDKLIEWVKAEIGSKLVKDQFGNTKKDI